MLSEVFHVVADFHAAALQKQPQLSTSLMLEMVSLFEPLVELLHARREKLLPQSFNIFEVKLELVVDDSLIEVARIERIQSLADEAAHLVFDIVIEHLDNGDSHLLELTSKRIRIQILYEVYHGIDVHVDVALPHEAEALPESRLTVLHRHGGILLNFLLFGEHYLMAKLLKFLCRHVELLRPALQIVSQHFFQQNHKPAFAGLSARESAVQANPE